MPFKAVHTCTFLLHNKQPFLLTGSWLLNLKSVMGQRSHLPGGSGLRCIPAADVRAGVLPCQLLQGDDDVLQMVEGEVDVLGLAEDTPIRSGLCHALGPGKINKVELRPYKEKTQ